MKIQTVRFKNLNSLTGEWLIDFSDPHFTSSGIFAIVGATGAGKTTILDAISLALYGRTPRLKQISKSTNELMSRQTGDCFAEVEFTSIRGNYRVHWSQHRARKNVSGELQPQKHEFADAQSGKVLASKLKDVTDQVIAATGMNFEQFTRSMLLAQGEFSKFLQANSDQRAPILEQITGTEIYSRISKQVHHCKVEEETKLLSLTKELEDFTIPTREELLTIEAEQKKLITATSQLQEKINTTNAQLNWHENLVNLQEKKKELENDHRKFQAQWDVKAAEREQLEKANQSHLLQAPYNHLSHLRQNQKDELAQLSTYQKSITEADQALVTLQQQTNDAKERFLKESNEQQTIAATILIVRQLDYENEKSSKDISNINRNIQSLQSEIDKSNQTLQLLEKDITISHGVTEKIKVYQKDNATDESLIETFSGIEEKASQFELLIQLQQKQLSSLQTSQEKLLAQSTSHTNNEETIKKLSNQEGVLTEKIATQENQIKDLAPGGLPALYSDLHALQLRLAHLHELKKLTKEQRQLTSKKKTELANQATLTNQLGRLRKEGLEVDQRLELQTTVVKAKEDLVLLTHRLESFEKERAKLMDNSPCPLCGSTEHPYRSSLKFPEDDAEQNLGAEKQKLAEITSKKQETEIELHRIQHSLDTSKAASLEIADRLDNIQQSVDEKCSARVFLKDIDEEITTLETSVVKDQQTIQTVEKYSQDLGQLVEQQKQLRIELSTQRENLLVLKEKTGKLGNEIEALSTASQETELAISGLKKTLTELISPHSDIRITDQKSIRSIVHELQHKRLLWKKSIAAEQDQKQLLQKYGAQRDTALQSVKLQSKEQAKLKQQLATLSSEHNISVTKRTTLFGTKDPSNVEKEMHLLVTSAEQVLRTVELKLQNADKQRSILHERSEQLKNSTAKRLEKLKIEEETFSQLLRDSKFASEDLFLRAKMEEKERNQLRISLETIATNLTDATNKLKNLDESILEERAKQTTTLTQDILKTELVEQTTELGQMQQQLGALTEQLRSYKTNIQTLQDKQELFQKQKIEFNHWAQLHSLIGSADGKKFRNFAQGLTFELMVHHANQTLEKMSDRYLLRRTPESPLELTVIDAYQAGEIRSTSNLSGGETFIISLALALGLSAMASQKVQIDSLFLDEGFGTLDEDSLEIALETLSTLQQRGKIIGIISHVPLLMERIDVQLHLHPGLDGRSKISGPGVTQPQLH